MDLDIVEQDNVVNIRSLHSGDLLITVPRRSSLQLKTTTGSIDVEQVDGEIDADAMTGKITLTDVSGPVLAHTLNGAIIATLTRTDPTKPLSFSTMNGPIDVTLPENAKANLQATTYNGAIYTDFDVKLDAAFQRRNGTSGQTLDGGGPFRMDRTVRGTINGGGPVYQFTSYNGKMVIHKGK
jgi:DUF4097 and DUF4098 domain-containing protein YvlB